MAKEQEAKSSQKSPKVSDLFRFLLTVEEPYASLAREQQELLKKAPPLDGKTLHKRMTI